MPTVPVRLHEETWKAFKKKLIDRGETAQGYLEKKIMEYIKPDYCTQDAMTCETCSLTNYRRDCQNNPID